jgi:cytochrome P450
VVRSRPHTDANLFDPAVVADPYPFYESIRSAGNVVWNEAMRGWNVVGFDELREVVSDSGERFRELNGDPGVTYWFEAPNLITVDGAEHRRLRGGLAPFFTRNAVAKWEQRVTEVVIDLVRPLAEGHRAYDLIADFTMIPTVVVADLLGISSHRYSDFRRWSHAIVSNLSYGAESEEAQAVMRTASTEINAYIQEEIERHRRETPDDTLTAMLELSGRFAMNDDEIRSAVVLLVLAGYDTTAKMMGNALLALERHPDQRRHVAADESLLAATIEESLRWCGPVQATARVVVTDSTLGEVDLSEGETLYLLHAAANRDPRRWEDPATFDIHREQKSHLALGWGPHLCLGAPLARLETRVAIEHLLRVAPEYSLKDVDFGSAFFVRGPERGLIEV